MCTYNHWITDTEQPITAKAFTYTIWFPLLGQRYIGYKTINSRSKWLSYKSSSKPVKELISNGHTAVYRIVKWFDNADDARVEEVHAMTSYDVTNRSEYLNQCIGGVKFSTAGRPISDETKAKMSAANKGKTLSNETRAKIGAASRNRSAETKAKMSAASKGRTHTDETRAKIRAAKKGRTLSDETRAKISAAKHNISDLTRSKMSKVKQKGFYVTPLGVFNTGKEASIANNCTISTIGNRCKSTKPQFKDWSVIRNKTPINRDKS